MEIKEVEISEFTKKMFCEYHGYDCKTCPYKLKEKYGIWCRAEGGYIKIIEK